MFVVDFNFEFKQNQSDSRPSNVCENQPRYSNSFEHVPSFNSNSSMNQNGSTTTTTNFDENNSQRRAQRPTTMQTSTESQKQFDAMPVNTFSSNSSKQNHHNTQLSSPTITGNSSNASTPSMVKSMSSGDDGRPSTLLSSSNGRQSPLPPASGVDPSMATTSTRTKPTLAKINALTKMKCCNDAGSGCECSDDELITKFRESYGDQPLSPVATMMSTATDATKSPAHLIQESLSNSSTKTGNSSGNLEF